MFHEETGEPCALRLDLVLSSATDDAVALVAGFLQDLDAPSGSTILADGAAAPVQFGHSEGLGLYLPARETDEDAKLAVVEACTDAMGGAGIYQGSFSAGDRTALYFYGDSFNRMRAAITFVMSHDPTCRNAYARRLS